MRDLRGSKRHMPPLNIYHSNLPNAEGVSDENEYPDDEAVFWKRKQMKESRLEEREKKKL